VLKTLGVGGALATRWRSLLAGTLCAIAVLAALAVWWPKSPPPLVVTTPTARPTLSPSPLVVVHVIGAVASPGVYRLPGGSRTEQAVAHAGGFTEDADPTSLNLAASVVDGQQLIVRSKPSVQATIEPGAVGLTPARSDTKLNLNTASQADLDQLPGIGSVLAQRIIERRQRLGPFQAVEQLRDEKLLPGATYERIKDLITVN